MLSLRNDVYLVAGVSHSVLYDSRNGSLYHLDREACCNLSSLLAKGGTGNFTKSQETFVRYLTDKQLLIDGDSSWEGDIQRLRTESKIDFAWIEVTTSCNLKCIHCYEGDCLLRSEEMTMDTFIRVADELCSYGVRRIQLIGGEPLTCPHLRDFLDYVCGKFDYVEVYTNGTLITDTWIKYFKLNKIRLAFSVYSYEEKSHERVTGVLGSWERTNSAIQKIADAGIKYRVRNVLIKDVPLGSRNTNLYTLNENKDVVRMVGNANVHLLSVENIRKRLITKQRFARPVSKGQVVRMVSGHNCFSNHLYFDVHGIVYPCVMERRLSHGNIHSAPLSQLLNPDILGFNKEHVEGCKDCEFRYFCFDCRSDSLGEQVNAKPWYCTYQPKTGEWVDADLFISELRQRYSF